MPNLLPQDMRPSDAGKKKPAGPPRVKMHMPEIDETPEPVAPVVKPAVPVAPSPRTMKAIAPTPPAPPRAVLSQTEDVVKEESKTWSWSSLFKKKPAAVASTPKSSHMNFIAPSIDAVVLRLFWEHVAAVSRATVTVVGLCAIVFAGMAVFQFQSMSQIKTLDISIAAVDSEILLYKSDDSKFRKLQERATVVQQLLAQHIAWTRVFDFLEQKTLPAVKYSSLVADVRNGLILNAVTSDYQYVAEQLAVMSAATTEVSAATVLAAQLVKEEMGTAVQFTLEAMVTDALLKPHGASNK